MKKIVILLIAAFASTSLYAQEPFTITEVVQTEGLSADDLYKNAKDWLIKTYVDAKEVIQYENREEGEIQGKATTKFISKGLLGSAVASGYINYLVIIKVKDGRYKYEFTNFVHHGTDTYQSSAINIGLLTTSETPPKIKGQIDSWVKKQWDWAKDVSEGEAYDLIPKLKEAMAKKRETENDW